MAGGVRLLVIDVTSTDGRRSSHIEARRNSRVDGPGYGDHARDHDLGLLRRRRGNTDKYAITAGSNDQFTITNAGPTRHLLHRHRRLR